MISASAPSVQVLQAARNLLAVINTSPHQLGDYRNLTAALDAYTYAVGILETPEIGTIEDVEDVSKAQDDDELLANLRRRFPGLGYYWQALRSQFSNDKEGELAVGDAIDDLLDITKELNEVIWIEDQHGQDQALAALRFRHEHHLYMHIFPLRLHLEEMRRES